MKDTLDKYGIDLVAVGLHEKLADDFLKKTGFKGIFVVNEKKDVFARVAKAGYLSILNPFMIKQYQKSQAMNLGGILDRLDGFQLGGLVVIDPPPDGKIIYQWDQPQIGVYPPVDEVLKNAVDGISPVNVPDVKEDAVVENKESETTRIEETSDKQKTADDIKMVG